MDTCMCGINPLILIIDDELSTRRLLQLVLTSTVGPIGAAMIYATAMGTIIRCPGCVEALIRIAQGRSGTGLISAVCG
jgi:Family of unknown function (DUF6510)